MVSQHTVKNKVKACEEYCRDNVELSCYTDVCM